MTHVGIQRLGAGDTQKHRAQHQKAGQAVGEQIRQAVNRIECGKHSRMLSDTVNAHHRHRREPQQHDRTKEVTNFGGALRLYREQHEQDHHRDGNDIRLYRRRRHIQAFQRRQHRNRGCDRAVAIDQCCTEQPDRDNGRAPLFLDAQKRHQSQNAALAIIVDAHSEQHIFDRRDDEQRP